MENLTGSAELTGFSLRSIVLKFGDFSFDCRHEIRMGVTKTIKLVTSGNDNDGAYRPYSADNRVRDKTYSFLRDFM